MDDIGFLLSLYTETSHKKLTCQCSRVGTVTRCHLQKDMSNSVIQGSFLVI